MEHNFFCFLTSTLDLNLRKKLTKCCNWSMALYGAETWTLRAADQKHLESFEMWCWSRMDSTDFNKTRWNIISFAFNKHIGLKFEEETNKMLYLEHGFVWC